ncbi:MAG TPA: hypothetical protein DCM45_06045, partial [Clostridiales bacterium]|nr:hypothetical protein [Clostridiales bacterium]
MKRTTILSRRLLIALVLISLLAVSLLSGCSNGKPAAGDTETYSFWLIQGEDSAYFADYKDNPVIQYLMTKTWGPENKKIDMEFVIPVAGQQVDNFNTLLSTGDYPDMMDATMYNGSLTDLYEQGIILELTDYIDKYMPNYKAFMESHPDEAQQAIHVVNGEKKILALRNFRDGLAYNWGGYMYRRDWIIKYGKNPVDGSAFSGSYVGTLPDGSVDKQSWEDNVIFPSGGPDPAYISDWEWMFEIFQQAIEDQGIEDGYVLSLYYPGFIATGDMISAFGCGNGFWFKNPEEKIVFGGTDDGFRTYLQAMSTWYANGWIDKAFTEHSSQMFYQIDEAKVRSGKVGFWYSTLDLLLGNLDDGEGYKAGMVATAARQPINDVYGPKSRQDIIPDTMYQASNVNNSWIITDKMKDRDIETLLTMLDYLYSEEGSILARMGLSKEQYEETKPELYTRFGLTEGAYYRLPEDQVVGTRIYKQYDVIAYEGGSLGSAIRPNRFFFLDPASLVQEIGTPQKLHNMDEWIFYKNTGGITGAINNQLTSDEQKLFTKTYNNINEFMAKAVPGFIKGEKDAFNDADWQAFVKALNKYGPDKMTAVYQEKQDNLG